MARFLRHFQPRLGLLVDTEVWPNTVALAKQRGIPLVLLNGRMSAKSLGKALGWSSLSRPAFQGLHAIWAQTQVDAQRFEQLGAKVQAVMGNLKFDAIPDPALLRQGLAWRARSTIPVVLLAISREGEEARWLQVLSQHPQYLRGVQWWVVPRHPQRFDEVADLVQSYGHRLIRRSIWGAQLPSAPEANQDAVVLGDSLGEMPFYYGAASVCLLGGSFQPLGGQNLIEACACGCPVVMGPHTFNFSQAAGMALKHGAATRVSTMAEAVHVAYRLATQEEACVKASKSASEFAQAHQGAVARCLAWMQPWLGAGSGRE